MNDKLKEFRNKSYDIKMKIALEKDLNKKEYLINKEKELLKEYRKFLFDLKRNEVKGGKIK